MQGSQALATVTVTKEMLIVAALCNGFTYGKLFHQLKEIVSKLLRYLWEIPGTFGRADGFCGQIKLLAPQEY